MVDNEPMTGSADHEQRHIRMLVSPQRVLDGVAALGPACHRDMPDIDGVVLAAVVAHAGWIILSDSGPEGDLLEDLHNALGEGPRVDAFTTGRPVAAADLARTVWPRFAPLALAGGIRAVFAFPVHLAGVPVGVLSAYRATAGPLSVTGYDRIGRYARTAAVLLRHDAHVDASGRASMPLPHTASEVQQAVGVVMEHTTMDAVTALHRLRAYAHHSRRPMRDVVTEVRTGQLPFTPTTPP